MRFTIREFTVSCFFPWYVTQKLFAENLLVCGVFDRAYLKHSKENAALEAVTPRHNATLHPTGRSSQVANPDAHLTFLVSDWLYLQEGK